MKTYAKYNNPFYISLFYHQNFTCDICWYRFVIFVDALFVAFMVSSYTINEVSEILF